MTLNDIDRRTVLRGAGAVAVGATLTACAGSSTTAASSTGTPTTTATAIGSFSAAPTSEAASSAAAGLGAATDVAVGGGKVYEAQKVVVTQPTAGAYKAFTAVCTHQGCLVTKVESGTIQCPCHGSSFSIKDGSVVTGPATGPLAEQKVTVTGGTIQLA